MGLGCPWPCNLEGRVPYPQKSKKPPKHGEGKADFRRPEVGSAPPVIVVRRMYGNMYLRSVLLILPLVFLSFWGAGQSPDFVSTLGPVQDEERGMELVDVFGRMGFSVAQGPELEDDLHNFVKLNIPLNHPAREPSENFYVDDPAVATAPRMLRSQTSTVQIRVMENHEPPLKIISPGRVYRPDTVDATHSFMFHQLEGLYVDRAVTMVDLKTTLYQFARSYFGADAEVRLVPSYFPFTEPSAEFYMKIRLKPDKPPEWVELGGCGMVDPAVFEAVGYDPERYTGFAFGMGPARIAMQRYRIPDIRLLYENDVRMLGQFR